MLHSVNSFYEEWEEFFKIMYNVLSRDIVCLLKVTVSLGGPISSLIENL